MGTELAKQDVAIQGGLVQLQTISDAKAFCMEVFQSGIAPASFKTPQAIFVAIQQGAELGLKPMQSLQGIAVVNGRATLYDKTARGIALKSGVVESLEDRFEGSGDDLTSITTIKRKGVQNAFVGKFSVSDAKKAGLWGKAGPWTMYPKDMLQHKSSSRALNAGFSDVLIGLPVYEDIQDLPPVKKPASNPTPVDDPLLNHPIIEAEIVTQNGASIHAEGTEEYNQSNAHVRNGVCENESKRRAASFDSFNNSESGSSEDLSSPPAGFESFDDEQPSYSQESEKTVEKVQNAVAGALVVQGEITQCWEPKSDKAPWNIVIAGVKMAVWKRTLPDVVKAFESKRPFKGIQFEASYTSEQKGQYTNNTLVSLTKI